MPRSKGWRDRKGDRTAEGAAIGDIVAGLLRRPEFARGVPIGTLSEAWPEIVGARLAAESAPLTLDDGLLVVAVTSGPWGAQARFLVDGIRDKANERLGAGSVTRVQVVVRPEAVEPLRRNGS
ncbi:MAG: DUF721 domain-containing protein [Actinomycetota bacterium]